MKPDAERDSRQSQGLPAYDGRLRLPSTLGARRPGQAVPGRRRGRASVRPWSPRESSPRPWSTYGTPTNVSTSSTSAPTARSRDRTSAGSTSSAATRQTRRPAHTAAESNPQSARQPSQLRLLHPGHVVSVGSVRRRCPGAGSALLDACEVLGFGVTGAARWKRFFEGDMSRSELREWQLKAFDRSSLDDELCRSFGEAIEIRDRSRRRAAA